MTQQYFAKFPIIDYGNTIIRDISRRVVFPPQLRNVTTVFTPYDLTNNQRSDVLAFNYYSDQDADWLIYLTNAVIDPYYGWYLNNDDFINLVISKYGNLTDPQQRVKYWITNWVDDDSNATTSYYNALPVTQQKYYQPVWGQKNQILFYKRRQEDWFQNTNQIWTLGVANTINFNIGDLVVSNNVLQTVEGQAEITGISDGGIIVIKDISNNFSVGSNLQKLSNNAISTSIANVSITQINIPLAEQVFWEPITNFKYEQILNEQRKSLLLVDYQYLDDLSTALQKNLNQ